MSLTKHSLKRFGRMVLWGLGGLLGLAMMVLLIGASWNALADARDGRRFPPPGQLIEVDGVRLHLHCTGQGQPTVVLDSGWAMPALGWTLVQPELAQRGRVCSYDRAGMGHSESDPTPAPHPPMRIAEDLHKLLQRTGERGPFVLVGHSHGGLMARAFYERFPKEVAGMVLVDATSEYMEERFFGPTWEKDMAASNESARRRGPLFRFVLWSGLGRWRLTKEAHNSGLPIKPEVIDEAIYLLNQPKWYRAAVAELDGVPESYRQLRAGRGLGDLPLIVLTAGKFQPKGAPPEKAEEWSRIWVQELQPQLARLSTRGRQVIADSGHLIPFEAPGEVVKAVGEVVAMIPPAPAREE
ncbi:MAG TPA: alpha/beta fold hydrolase [Polyangia bacterium]|jgi:pimeloyl-ACP methyl ester carboxylesterase|nr:alpha/beta fold hydrolase [Polyangia bacterium]